MSNELTQQQPKAVAPQSRRSIVKTFLQKNSEALKEALPRVGLTPEALVRTALLQIDKNPTLLECDQVTIMRSMVEAASLGLSFSLGRAHLVPFKNTKRNRMEAQLIPGYQGLADVARRSGEIKSINAQAVYKDDMFDFEFGLEADKLVHKPSGDTTPENLTHAYAIVRFKDGGYQVRVLTRTQIEATRKRSKSPNSPMWTDFYEEGAIKTAVKKVLKLCPASAELVRALELDNAHEEGVRQDLSGAAGFFGEDGGDEPIDAEVVVEKPSSRLASVGDALKQHAAPTRTAAPAQGDPASDLRGDIGVMLDALYPKAGQAAIAISEATAGKYQTRESLDAAPINVLERVANSLRPLYDAKREPKP